MASVFLSHSSKDKEIVRQLAEDLARVGHKPWLDQWEIKVGDCIITSVETGVSVADYVVLVLSPNSVSSGWVEREWKTRYWDEINQKKVILLPALIADCEIPGLLRTKLYADFRQSYAVGFANLIAAITPLHQPETLEDLTSIRALPLELSGLIERVQTPGSSLALTIAQALSVAHGCANSVLEKFCRNELSGYGAGESSGPLPYRQIKVFLAPNAEINPMFMGWSENLNTALDFMSKDPENFIPYTLQLGSSVPNLEERAAAGGEKKLLTFNLPRKTVFPNTKNPDAPLIAYARGESLNWVLGGIRMRFTELLLDMLPQLNTSDNSG